MEQTKRPVVWLVGVLACALGGGSTGCSSTCQDGDFECLLGSLVIYDLGTRGSSDPSSTAYQQFEPRLDSVADGPLEIIWVQTDTLPPSGGSVSAPSITNQPPPMTVGTPDSVEAMQFDYTDSNECRPSICHVFSNIRYFRSPCTPMSRDGWQVGRTYLGYRYEKVPETTTADLQADVVPVSGKDCPSLSDEAVSGDGSFDDPMVLGSSADSVLGVGSSVSVTFTVVSEADASSSGGGGGGTQCSPWVSYCGTCGQFRNCVTQDGSSCNSQWYEAGGGVRIACASCGDCADAAYNLVYACGCDQP